MKEIKKIYGPYAHKKQAHRKFIIICYEDGSRVSRSLARHMMEQHLGRELGPDEVVDHINNDCTDDRIDNFQILTVADNVRKSNQKAEFVRAVCVECGKEYEALGRQLRYNQGSLGKNGPFCGRSCAGRWSQRFQKTFRGGRKNPSMLEQKTG